jgi:hypothetical protein
MRSGFVDKKVVDRNSIVLNKAWKPHYRKPGNVLIYSSKFSDFEIKIEVSS